MNNKYNEECHRCGNCCKEGGPALHEKDLPMLLAGKIPLSHLVTIRRGELTTVPTKSSPFPTSKEFVKLVGKGKSWCCRYYEEDMGCSVYDFRPQACQIFKCWNTKEILALMGKELLTRRAILGKEHLILPAIEEHEALVSCEFFADFFQGDKIISQNLKVEIEKRVQRDLLFREQFLQKASLSLGEEMFYFGRPLFQLLQPLGVAVVPVGKSVQLRWKK